MLALQDKRVALKGLIWKMWFILFCTKFKFCYFYFISIFLFWSSVLILQL
jgi:hypothetical protein